MNSADWIEQFCSDSDRSVRGQYVFLNRGPAVGRMVMRAIWSGVLIAASTAIGMTDVYAQELSTGKMITSNCAYSVTERQAKETGNLPSLSKDRREI